MKNVLCLIENLGPGGAERQLTGLAVMLQQQGWQTEVCYYVKNEFYLSYLLTNGVNGCFLSEASNSKKRFFALRKHIKAVKPDTVISFSASSSIIACLLKLSGAKFNLVVSERNTTQIIDKRVKLRFFVYRWADHIVPNSQSQALFISKYFSNLSNKVKVITNFVDTDQFSPINKSLPWHEETNIVCVGRLMRQKNIPLFVNAIKRIVDDGYNVHLNWFGQDLMDDYSEECHAAISDSHLENVFVFHTPSSKIQYEYCRADVFCLPSLYEGFPNVLCEAMSCGLPILCSRVCDNPSIVYEGKNGYMFNPNCIDDMVATIECFINLSAEKKKDMGIKSREIAVDLFSKDRFIQNYISLL